MKKRSFGKKLKRKLGNLLNSLFISAIIFFVVFSAFSYQIAFTSHISSADEGEAIISESFENSESEEGEEEVIEEEIITEEVKEEPVKDEEIEADEESSEIVPDSDENSSEETLVENTESTNEQTEVAADVKEDDCVCDDEGSDELKSEDCDLPQPENCQCLIDYCSKITSINNAEEVASVTEAESVTGGNEIVGETESSEISQEETEVAENEILPEEDLNNENQDSEQSEESSEGSSEEIADAVIETGDANSEAIAVNEINTNIYTDNGQEMVENISGDYAGDINLLEAFDSVLENSKDLYEQNEEHFEKITVVNINSAEKVENNVSALADSGENKIANIDGDASIETGNASAIASAVNLINTNITGNNWLFAIVNIFGNWTGDLIVPGEGLLETPAGKMIFDKIVSINYASDIKNFVYAGANTGGNSENNVSGDASIETGSAFSQASSVNLVNTNIIKNNWFFLLINNSGNWIGKVINWNKDTGEQNTAYEYEFGSLDEENESNSIKVIDVYNSNYAEDVSNYVSSYANSGNNLIESSESASIQTGNANAFASAFNFVNTNITGNNWLFGIVNNAGNWTGNVIFGYPDLEISLSADKRSVEPGENFSYMIRYKNIGKAKCDNAELMLSFPKYLSYLSDTNGSPQNDSGNYYWSASGLKPGEERSFSVSVRLDENVPREITELQSSTGIRTETMEKDLSNNYESESIGIAFPATIIIEDGDYWKEGSSLEVSRSENSRISMGALADYLITVKNPGKNTLFNLLVTEKIKDPSGNVAAEYSWVIEKLKKGQKATIQYQLFFGPPAQTGVYKHSASALGYNEYGFEVKSKKASSKVELVSGGGYQNYSGENPVPEKETVLGAENMPALSIPVMGGEKIDISGYFKWFWLLLLVPPAYYAWKKRLYRWEKIQKFAQQAANMLSSFF